jgi:hypothetical protein
MPRKLAGLAWMGGNSSLSFACTADRLVIAKNKLFELRIGARFLSSPASIIAHVNCGSTVSDLALLVKAFILGVVEGLTESLIVNWSLDTGGPSAQFQ